MSRRRPPHVLLTVVCVVSASLLLAACGGSSNPSIAHITSGRGASSASPKGGGSSPESTANPEQAMIAFAQCMHSNGVPNLPDSGLIPRGAGIDPSSPLFKTAQAKCQKLIPGGGPPGPGLTTHPSAQTLARFLKISQCMRRHGISQFPDPTTSVPPNPFGSGIREISNIEEVILLFPATIDQQAPAFTQAAAACGFPLHNH